MGESDPEIIPLMSMFEKGIGPDTISDLTTNAILPILCEITEQFCAEQEVSAHEFTEYGNRRLPRRPKSGMPILLVPTDILRDLPLAADWSDVSRVILEIEGIRDRFNAHLGNIVQATITQKKAALRKTALESLENFRAIFSAVISASDSYDPKADPLNQFRFRELLAKDLAFFKFDFLPPTPSRSELKRVVLEIVVQFRRLIEKNNLWELLWDKDKPKRERAAQLVFFGCADMFCRANDIEIAPETNSGGGPVDFRFSKGYRNRVVVEMKLSTGRVVHGFDTQVRVYEYAADTDASIVLVVNVGGMKDKLVTIQEKRTLLLAKGKPAPEIELVDARRRKPASTRETKDSIIDDIIKNESDDDDPQLNF